MTGLLNASLNLAALQRAAESVREYDGSNMAKRVAALQLMPENACQLGHLAAAARVVAHCPWRDAVPRSRLGDFERILHWSPFTDELTVHDPRYDDVFCESVGFIGGDGDYLASSGLGAEVPFVLNAMIEVVMSGPGPLPRELTVDAKQLIGATLDLSHKVLTAAGLRRNQLPLGDPTEPITFPDRSRLASLVDAVSFRSQEIAATLAPDGLLERLMYGYEAVMHARFEQEFKLPTRLACYESWPEVQSRLRSERPKPARTAIAWRFLIEYVAAVPPRISKASGATSTRGSAPTSTTPTSDSAGTSQPKWCHRARGARSSTR
jgi:hypothetical protein